MHNKRRHQILLMTPNDFHTPLTAPHFIFCSISILLLFTEMTFWTNHLLSVPLCPLSFCTLSLVSILECLFFHQVKPDDLCLVAPCQWLMFPLDCTSLTLDFTSRAFSSPFVMAACFCCFKYNTHFTLCQPVFYFFLFFLYISHNCLFYCVFSDNLFFFKKNVLCTLSFCIYAGIAR